MEDRVLDMLEKLFIEVQGIKTEQEKLEQGQEKLSNQMVYFENGMKEVLGNLFLITFGGVKIDTPFNF